MNRLLSLLIILLICAKGVSSPAFTDSERDSICAHIPKIASDSSKLEYLVNLAIAKQNTSDFLFLSDLLLKEAQRQKDIPHEAKALYYHVVYYYNQGDQEQAVMWRDRMMPVALKGNMYYEYFNGQRFVIDLYSISENYERAIDEASKMMAEAEKLNNKKGQVAACISLGNAYIGSGRYREGAQTLERALPLIDRDDKLAVVELTLQLTSTFELLADNENCLKYITLGEEAMEGIKQIKKGAIEGYRDIYLFFHLSKANVYIRQQERELATLYRDSASLYFVPEKTFFMYRLSYLTMNRDYAMLFGDNAKALELNDEAIEMVKEDFPSQYMFLLNKKAEILMNQGSAEEALAVYKELIPGMKAVNNEISHKQLRQLQESYDLEQATLKREKNKSANRRITLIFAVLFLLSLTLTLVKIRKIKKELLLSKRETEEATHIVEKSNELKSIFLKNISHEIRTPLNAVVGFSDLLSTETVSQTEVREYSSIVKRNSDLLIRLINDVLDLSRLESGMMQFNFSRQNFITLCHEAVHSTEKGDETEFRFDYPEELVSRSVETDQVRLTETIRSSLSSPYRKSVRGTVHLQLSLNEKKECLELRVTGSPLADPFSPSQSTKLRNEINRLVIDKMGGSYQVLPETENGPVVVITYPLN